MTTPFKQLYYCNVRIEPWFAPGTTQLKLTCNVNGEEHTRTVALPSNELENFFDLAFEQAKHVLHEHIKFDENYPIDPE